MTPQQLQRTRQLLKYIGPAEYHVGLGTANVYDQGGRLVADCNTPQMAALTTWLLNNAPELLEAAGRNGR